MDLFTEAPTRSGYPLLMSFNQPQVESLLEKAVLDRGIPLLRGFGESSLLIPVETSLTGEIPARSAQQARNCSRQCGGEL